MLSAGGIEGLYDMVTIIVKGEVSLLSAIGVITITSPDDSFTIT
jgi:hypothetical protein